MASLPPETERMDLDQASASRIEHRGGFFASKEPEWLVRPNDRLGVTVMGRRPTDLTEDV